MQKLLLVRYNKLTDKSDFFAGYDSTSNECLRWSSIEFAWLLSEDIAQQLLDYLALQVHSKSYTFYTKVVDFSIITPYNDKEI